MTKRKSTLKIEPRCTLPGLADFLAGKTDTPPAVAVWNTGRLYTRVGQIIGAMNVAGGVVFKDTSRMIDGFIKSNTVIPTTDLRAFVMYAYDAKNDGTHWQGLYEPRWGNVSEADFKVLTDAVNAQHDAVALKSST